MGILYSMTGFGRVNQVVGNREILIEIKSVNHRYFECNVKTPRLYGYLEDKLKKLVQEKVSRGKVDINLYIHFTEADNVEIVLNETLVKGYLDAFTTLQDDFDVDGEPDLSLISKMPDIFTLNKPQEDEEQVWLTIAPIAQETLERFNEMRAQEGVHLQNDILHRLGTIREAVKKIEEVAPQTVSLYRERLYTKMREVLEKNNIDDNRILLEAGIFAEKVAVDEETVRLRSHIEAFEKMCESPVPVGRKMDFLIQEVNREVNTIGSKAQNSEIAKTVIDLKGEIEKIREQVQNIE